MLQYRLTNDTDDFVEGVKEQLVLFIIHSGITYEHYIDHKYDTQRIIQHIDEFTVEPMIEYINVKYYSMTFRLNPIGENIKLIIQLQERIAVLEKKLMEIPKQITIQKPPEYLPPNLTLLHEIQYLPWDTLEDLLYMCPLDKSEELYKKFNIEIRDYNGGIIKFNYKMILPNNPHREALISHKLFIDGLQFFKIDIDTFDPDDLELNRLIDENKANPYGKLSKSCKQPFTYNKKINIHILNFISYIVQYEILSAAADNRSLQPFIHCYINSSHLYIHMLRSKVSKFYKLEMNGHATAYFHKYRMNFYIDDWSAPPVVVYV